MKKDNVSAFHLRLKRSIFVLAALGSACREFTVSALTRFSWSNVEQRKRTYTFLLRVSVSALTGFSERRNGVRPPEVFALSRYAWNFEKELHFVQIFFKIPFAS